MAFPRKLERTPQPPPGHPRLYLAGRQKNVGGRPEPVLGRAFDATRGPAMTRGENCLSSFLPQRSRPTIPLPCHRPGCRRPRNSLSGVLRCVSRPCRATRRAWYATRGPAPSPAAARCRAGATGRGAARFTAAPCTGIPSASCGRTDAPSPPPTRILIVSMLSSCITGCGSGPARRNQASMIARVLPPGSYRISGSSARRRRRSNPRRRERQRDDRHQRIGQQPGGGQGAVRLHRQGDQADIQLAHSRPGWRSRRCCRWRW